MSLRNKFRSGREGNDVVRRAARSADASRSRDRGATRFLLFVAAIVVVGTTTVGYAWAERQYDHPTEFDSWQNAYGVYDCQTDTWLDPFESLSNPNGIRTRGDGVIYIEPTTQAATGNNAQLGLFLDTVGVTLDDQVLTLPSGETMQEQGTSCNGEDAILQVLRFADPVLDPASVEIRTADLSATRFLADQEALVIALAPRGAAIDLPPSAASLSARTVDPS